MEKIQLKTIEFGEYVARRRVQVGFKTQKSLALELDKDTSTVGKIETGERSPSLEVLLDLAVLLQVRPTELLSRLVSYDVEDFGTYVPFDLTDAEQAQVEQYAEFLISRRNDFLKVVSQNGVNKSRGLFSRVQHPAGSQAAKDALLAASREADKIAAEELAEVAPQGQVQEVKKKKKAGNSKE